MQIEDGDSSRETRFRRLIEEQYMQNPTIRRGKRFGEILCHELHTQKLTFTRIAEKWNISLEILGELICDHCKRLGGDPVVNHAYGSN